MAASTFAATVSTPSGDPPRYAPVAVFGYARKDHLERTLSSLRFNAEAASTDLYVFCDAARGPQDQPQVDAVRRYVDSLQGFASITRVLRERNMGLARSMIEGVSEVLRRHGRVIVVEDDLLLSPHFLRYMNDALEHYYDDERIASIHGWCFPSAVRLPETFFLRGADCWGWATWSRAWAHFEPDGTKLLAELRARKLTQDFDLNGSYPYMQMLEDQVAGRNHSWAIRWHAACYLRGLLTLYPGRSLVENIGNDGSGTHCGSTGEFPRAPTVEPVKVAAIEIEASPIGRASFEHFLGRQQSFASRVRRLAGRALVRAR